MDNEVVGATTALKEDENSFASSKGLNSYPKASKARVR